MSHRVLATAGSFVAIWVSLGISHAQRTEPAEGPCGRLRAWNPPPGLMLQQGPDKRSWDTLTTQGRLWHMASRIETACEILGRYPSTIEEINMALRRTGRTCQLDTALARDAWGSPIFYGVIRAEPVLVSAGPDGVFATEDDISTPGPHDTLGRTIDTATECK